MNIIKINYNNAAVKKPKKIKPSFTCNVYRNETDGKVLRVTINSNLDLENFYTDYEFTLYVNDKILYYFNSSTPTSVDFVGISDLFYASMVLQLKGYYENENNKVYFETEKIKIYNYPICSENISPNDNLLCCGSITYGYLINNVFYTEITDGEYSSPADSTDGIFVDIDSNIIYKWDNSDNQYIII